MKNLQQKLFKLLLISFSSCSIHEWSSALPLLSPNSSFSYLHGEIDFARHIEDENSSLQGPLEIEDGEDSSGIYSASTSSHEQELHYISDQSLTESSAPVAHAIGSSFQPQTFSRKTRCHDTEDGLERPPRKRSFLDESIVDPVSVDSPKFCLINNFEEFATSKGFVYEILL